MKRGQSTRNFCRKIAFTILCSKIGIIHSAVQRNTGVAARALAHNLSWYSCGCRYDVIFVRRKKGRKVVKDSAFATTESSRCCRPTPLLFTRPLFFRFLSIHAYVFLRFPLYRAPSRISFPPLLSSHRHLSLASLQLLAGNVSAISPVISWRRVHTSRASCRVKYTESDFQSDAKPGICAISSVVFVCVLKESTGRYNSRKSDRFIRNYIFFFNTESRNQRCYT